MLSASRTSRSGGRSTGFDTSVPTRAVVVTVAIAASTVHPSNLTLPDRCSVRQPRAWSGT